MFTLSCQRDNPEDNADPVGDTTTKGCYSGVRRYTPSHIQVGIDHWSLLSE